MKQSSDDTLRNSYNRPRPSRRTVRCALMTAARPRKRACLATISDRVSLGRENTQLTWLSACYMYPRMSENDPVTLSGGLILYVPQHAHNTHNTCCHDRTIMTQKFVSRMKGHPVHLSKNLKA